MSDSIATLSVDVVVPVDKALAGLAKLQEQLEKMGKPVKTDPVAPVADGARKATPNVLALAQAESRLLAAQGNLAGAADRLRNALAQVDTTTVQSINAQRQLLAVETQLATGTSALGGHFKDLQGSVASIGGAIGGLPGQLLSVTSGIGAVTTAIGIGVAVVKSFADAFAFKAELDATTNSIRLQLNGVRDSNQVFAEGQQFAKKYGLTQQELTDSIQSSIGVMRASNASTTDLLTTLSRLQVLAPEKPISEAARALRELASGDTTSIKELFNIAAKDANQMKQEIQGGADAVSVLSGFLDKTGIGMDTLAARTQGAAGKMIEVKQAQEALTLAQGQFAQGPGIKALEIQTTLLTGLTRLLNGGGSISEGLQIAATNWKASTAAQFAYGAALNQGLTATQAQAAATQAFNTSLQASAGATAAATAESTANAAATAAYAAALEATGSTTQANAAYEQALAASLQATAAAATVSTGAMVAAAAGNAAHATSAQLATDAAAKQAAATQQTAEAAVLAAAQQAAQTQITANLTAATTEAVNAFLNLNPNIDAAGIAAAVAAGKIPALIGQLANLRIAAYSARDAVAALAAQQAINTKVLATPGIAAPGITSGRNNDVNAVVALQKANADAADARSQQILTIGTEQQQVNELEKQYGAAVKASGADSAAAINAETKLKKARIDAAKADAKSAKKGKGGGGGTKLTDQQKLNNSLLSDTEKFTQKEEDIYTQHAIDVEKINLDFYAKMKKARDDFQQSQLDSNASFYSSLGDITNHGLQQSMSAEYEAAFQEAQQIAQTKGADVADAFLKAKQETILAQGKRAQEIADAENGNANGKGKDAARAEYLKGVDALARKAEEAKLARIKEGEGSIASEQQAALDAADAKLADSLDKNAVAASRSADARVLANQRAGKSVTDEAAQVDGLTASYDRLNTVSGRTGATPTPATTPATTSPAPATGTPATQGGAQAAPGDIASALAALRDAIGAVERATTNAGKGVESAVRGLSGKFAT